MRQGGDTRPRETPQWNTLAYIVDSSFRTQFMGNLDLFVVIAYMAGILAAGFWARRQATTQDQFLVAGRSVGPTLYAGTLAAIVLGGASTVGGVKLGYQFGSRACGSCSCSDWGFSC